MSLFDQALQAGVLAAVLCLLVLAAVAGLWLSRRRSSPAWGTHLPARWAPVEAGYGGGGVPASHAEAGDMPSRAVQTPRGAIPDPDPVRDTVREEVTQPNAALEAAPTAAMDGEGAATAPACDTGGLLDPLPEPTIGQLDPGDEPTAGPAPVQADSPQPVAQDPTPDAAPPADLVERPDPAPSADPSETPQGVPEHEQAPPASPDEPELAPHREEELVAVGVDPLVKAQVVISENSRQVLQEVRTLLPPGTIKVRDITHRILDVRCELLDDKAIVQLVLEKQVFFVGPDNLVHHASERVNISTFVDVPGTRPGMICQPRVTVEHILFHLEDCVLVQKILLDVFVKVTQRQIVNLVETTEGLPIKALEVVADVTGQLVEEFPVTLTIPAIKVVEVRVTIPPESLTIEPINDKVIIQGVIHKQIFFIDQNDVERHQAVDVAFSTFVEAPGTRPGHVVLVEPIVVFTAFELVFPPGATATTQLLEKVVIDFLVNVANLRVMEVEESPTGTLIKAEVVLGQGTGQLMIERDVTLPVAALKVSDVLARVENLRAISLPGKVLVQGNLHKQLFFVGLDDGLEHHQAENIAFSTAVEVLGSSPDLLVQVTPTVEHVVTELLSPVLVHQKVILRLDVIVAEERQVRLAVAPYPAVVAVV